MLSKTLGGLEQSYIDYQKALEHLGHNTIAVYHPKAAIKSAILRKHRSTLKLSNVGSWDLLATLKLAVIIKMYKIDIIIAHGNRAITLSRRANFLKSCKIIAVTHNYRQKVSLVDAVFATTPHLQLDAINRGAKSDQTFVIPNMIDMSRAVTRRRFTSKKLCIGALARCVEKKGFSVLIHALAQLKERGLDFEAILAGDGIQIKEYRSLSRSLGLTDIISFPGWVTDKEKFFNSIDIFCLPSLHEPFGITLLEAAKHSVPIVATETGGPKAIITDNIDGKLCRPGDPNDLSVALQQTLLDSLKRQSYARNAHQGIALVYAIDNIAFKIDAALNAVSNTSCRANSIPAAADQDH